MAKLFQRIVARLPLRKISCNMEVNFTLEQIDAVAAQVLAASAAYPVLVFMARWAPVNNPDSRTFKKWA